ncbi:insecticidal delta-endotoxin Cry8Ea1 family protein [Bacillus cereus]|nr:insecticidal delta-endotoxin Cry8Ea1 family protein [Bacillus cereus]MDA2129212.1 insecticidal delta-endotoxin Cry8Ea1 family protein [Bacillus cereus]MDA2151567.1 insecticidal delta-endotoxin Cry8Ea1 family protein [Bacillus cereus]MDA2525832.1 insecticidal delta-endotoxin Cry8Ea1 family protein [Bacillus cereus]MDA2537325.1 insecticidal delta-endotoxin Cry8Ea1 family protein [Bacillus cereus]
MENNIQNQCVPYNCLSNPEEILLDGERISTGNSSIDISLSLVQLLVSNFVPGGGFLVGLLDFVWGIVGPSPWDAFLVQIEQLINERIAAYARSAAISNLEGLGNNFNIYVEAFKEWEADPDNPVTRTRVVDRFRILDGLLERDIPSFRIAGFEVPLLSVYAQAANLHLAILRDSSIFGARWGLTTINVNENYNRLIRHIDEYANHCADTYNRGLNNLPKSTYQDWITYNRLRRDLTLTVLDIAAFFPSYDNRRYPIQSVGQLTREIYTDPLITFNPQLQSVAQLPTFNVMESNAIRTPHLFDVLNNLTIFTDWFSVGRNFYWGGHRVISNRIGGGNITSPIYGREANQEPPRSFTFNGPVFRTLSNPTFRPLQQPWPAPPFNLRGVEGVEFSTPLNSFTYRGRGTVDSLNELPPEDNSVPPREGYSHRLCHATFVQRSGTPFLTTGPVFSWTHRSATDRNIIYPDVINQIPLVKAFNLTSGTSVVRGPGFTGGDIIRTNVNGSVLSMSLNFSNTTLQRYRVRVRYAASQTMVMSVTVGGSTTGNQGFPSTMSANGALTSQSFRFAEFPVGISASGSQGASISISNNVGRQMFHLDRIEFLPVTSTFEEEYDLERAQEAVNALFTSTNQLGLKTDVTDYHIDQVSNLVECLSDEFCLDEKRELSEKVKHAKRLSDERNLLQDRNFRSINGQLDRGWRGSTDITIQGGDDVFKENYVTLPGTFDECYPTYLYQKIDESKLKSYTRYELRGYIEDSQDLEIYLIRYNAKHEIVNVPGTGSLWPLSIENSIGPCGEPNRCAPHLEWNPNLDCSCRDGEKCAHHSHHFSLDIDVGCTDLNEDLGVWVIFKIKTQDGHARLGNLEFLEEKPLLGEALARVKRAEKKWRDKREKLEWETNIVYKEAKESVDALFVNSQYDRLQADTNIAMIHAADKRVHRIREAYLPELSVIPGVNAGIFEELEGRIFTAYSLYDARNVIKNGDFNNGLLCWNLKGHVDVEEQNNHRSVLVVPEWEAEVSQEVRVCPGRGYILRVTAYKEGYGEGCVTIHEIEDNTDELKFSNCVEEEVYPNNTVTCNDYTATQEEYGGAYTSRNHGYGKSYESNSSVQADYASVYEEKADTDGRRDNHCESNRGYGDYTPLPAGYVTKELEYFPETDKVWVEIGETEGTFIVDSVELLLMEE